VALANANDVAASHRTPNSVTFSQKFADDVGANKARSTSNENDGHDEESKGIINGSIPSAP